MEKGSKGGKRAMLLNFSVKGFKAFYDEVSLSMVANNYIKKNKDNTIEINTKDKEISVVKTALIFGPNNSGKTCFLDAIRCFVDIIKAEKIPDVLDYNLFSNDRKMSFKIEFLENSKIYGYELHLNSDEIENEILTINGKPIFERANITKSEYKSLQELNKLIGGYKNKLFISTLPEEEFREIVYDFKKFFDRFEFVKEELYSFRKERLRFTEDISNENYRIEIANFIKNADLLIDDIKIDDRFVQYLKERNAPEDMIEENKACSIVSFKDKSFSIPFFWFNSKGTIKTALLAQRIINAIKNNKILVIDEIDGSLHTILTKELLNYLNSVYNPKSQIIATTQDLLLLDDKYLLRKDQIWFIYKDKETNYLYSLDNFKDNEEVDARGNVLKRYLKGLYGALPLPSIIGSEDGDK